jgi:TonB family protein
MDTSISKVTAFASEHEILTPLSIDGGTMFRRFVALALFSFGFVGNSFSAEVPKDKAAFTTYMQAKLQLYSPSPIKVLGPLSLSVGTSNASVTLPSLKPLHKLCVASPLKCDHAINDYVQDVTREFLQKPAAAASQQPPATSVADLPPSCSFIDGPNTNPHDKCTAPVIDRQGPPANFQPCGDGFGSLRTEGVVIVNFTVRADGSVSDPTVVAPSGSTALDDVAVSSIAARHYAPATKNGKPIDTPQKSMKTMFQVSCPFSTSGPTPSIHETVLSPASPSTIADTTKKPSCASVDGKNASPLDRCSPPVMDLWRSPTFHYDFGDITRGGEIDPVVLEVTVNADGTVGDVVILQSSGFKMIDNAAVSQARGRFYFPATKNGRPISMQVRSLIRLDWH